ncbi:hypothetical protein RRG08_049996 [Elysia crispata]|uniref:Uncharacterized protein n=1 Tax=Elysia crispata TaxID=231223 RepID=A0AAE1BAU9_9GAST|nr:hypothetical protein RRG08_049996 [Elysia crispata]
MKKFEEVGRRMARYDRVTTKKKSTQLAKQEAPVAICPVTSELGQSASGTRRIDGEKGWKRGGGGGQRVVDMAVREGRVRSSVTHTMGRAPSTLRRHVTY